MHMHPRRRRRPRQRCMTRLTTFIESGITRRRPIPHPHPHRQGDPHKKRAIRTGRDPMPMTIGSMRGPVPAMAMDRRRITAVCHRADQSTNPHQCQTCTQDMHTNQRLAPPAITATVNFLHRSSTDMREMCCVTVMDTKLLNTPLIRRRGRTIPLP